MTKVVCCDGPEHRGRVSFIADVLADGETVTQKPRKPNPDDELGKHLPAVEILDAEGRRVPYPFGERPTGTRWRLVLDCPLCPLRVELTRERARLFFEPLARAGMAEITLRKVIEWNGDRESV